ncbi:gas vesicle protein K [Patescibacteria group bacterium]|nr:gas vesicle protein K [Patescibacteria group bacterium]
MDKPSVILTIKDPEEVKNSNPGRIDIDPKNVEKGLAKLVLTLVELIRKLLEKQAMRRVEGGSLSDEEIERVGQTLMKLEIKMKELKEIFGLKDEELNLNLGPLGDLM